MLLNGFDGRKCWWRGKTTSLIGRIVVPSAPSRREGTGHGTNSQCSAGCALCRPIECSQRAPTQIHPDTPPNLAHHPTNTTRPHPPPRLDPPHAKRRTSKGTVITRASIGMLSKLLLVSLGFFMCHIYWSRTEHLVVFCTEKCIGRRWTRRLVCNFPAFVFISSGIY